MRSYGPFKVLLGNNVPNLFLTSERGKSPFSLRSQEPAHS